MAFGEVLFTDPLALVCSMKLMWIADGLAAMCNIWSPQDLVHFIVYTLPFRLT